MLCYLCEVVIDAIMEMVGLENVKDEVLKIKATLDLANRQGASNSRDRYNVCMLGNPGTGIHPNMIFVM